METEEEPSDAAASVEGGSFRVLNHASLCGVVAISLTVNYETLSQDVLFEFARSRRVSLGIDADKNKLVLEELRTALAFEAETGLTLTRNTTAGSDWVRGSITYDALGPFGRGFDIEWQNGGIQDQLLQHLIEYDVVILDVVGLDSAELGALFEYLDSFGDTADVLYIVEGVPG